MKTPKYIVSVCLLFSLIINTSCRKEEIELIQAPPEETLSSSSLVANLMQRTAMNDGSNDNIIDESNCFNIQLPLDVIVNGYPLTINTASDYNAIEDIFDENDNDTDSIEIIFPITITFFDFSQVIVYSMDEFYTYASNCNGENEIDDDIECIDFQYPITASIFNSNNELISTISLNNDEDMYSFIDTIDANDLVSINFPIAIITSSGVSLTIQSLSELQNAIENYADDCDEDDDYDYNDDDCNGCSPLQLADILTNCSDWIVDKLERNDTNYDDAYEGYEFNFFNDGTVSVYWSSITVYGTWSTEGTGNNITVLINIPALSYCNLNWNLHEIEQNSGETKIDLREGDDDRLRYVGNCN